VFLLSQAGCDATHQLQAASAAQTGCAPADIKITDDKPDFGSRSWAAWCNNERFQCFGTGNSLSCKAAVDAEASTPTAPPAPPPVPAIWVKHEVKGCGVVAEFPSTPRDELRELHTSRGSAPLALSMSELADGKGEASVACGSPAKKAISDAAALDAARDGMLKNIGAILTEERDIIGGREVLFELAGEHGLARLFWVHDRVIVATAMPVNAFGPKAAQRFVRSVELAEIQ